MEIKLRPYQEESINNLSENWKNNKRQVLALTTGGGKTIIFSEIAKRSLSRNKRVLILTHRQELFEQSKKTFANIGIDAEQINSKAKSIDTTRSLFVAMVETIAKRVQLLDEVKPDLLIIDECHVGNFTKILDAYPDVYTLGVTATPIGKHFYNYYTNIVQKIDTPELIKQGYLVPCKAYQMVSRVEGLKKQNGEYTPSSMMQFYDKSTLYDGVVNGYLEKAKGKKTLIFNCNIEHSEKTSQFFNLNNIECKSLTSKNTKEERLQILEWFEKTPNAVLCNAGILTAGYDHPPIECIIVNRATMSLPLWLQMVGRGSRLSENKTNFILLDFGANHERHGLWQIKRTWALEPPKEKTEKASPIKECPNCNAVLPVSTRVCPECDYIFPIPKKQLETGNLIEVLENSIIGKYLSDLTIDEIVTIIKSKENYNIKVNILFRVVRSRGVEAMHIFGEKMGYKKGWVYMMINDNRGSNYPNLVVKWKR
jgi:superfamily II DNA or RNA helicase